MLVACVLLGLFISCEDKEVPFFPNVESLPDYRASYLKRFIETHLSNRDWKYSAFKKTDIFINSKRTCVGKESLLLSIIALSKEATREWSTEVVVLNVTEGKSSTVDSKLLVRWKFVYLMCYLCHQS
jgi:hypothetical protein